MLRSLAIAYRRREVAGEIAQEQKATHLTLTVDRFANHADEADWYRVGVPIETRTFEIVAPPEPTVSGQRVLPFPFSAIRTLIEGDEAAAGLLSPTALAPAADKTWPYETGIGAPIRRMRHLDRGCA